MRLKETLLFQDDTGVAIAQLVLDHGGAEPRTLTWKFLLGADNQQAWQRDGHLYWYDVAQLREIASKLLAAKDLLLLSKRAQEWNQSLVG